MLNAVQSCAPMQLVKLIPYNKRFTLVKHVLVIQMFVVAQVVLKLVTRDMKLILLHLENHIVTVVMADVNLFKNHRKLPKNCWATKQFHSIKVAGLVVRVSMIIVQLIHLRPMKLLV